MICKSAYVIIIIIKHEYICGTNYVKCGRNCAYKNCGGNILSKKGQWILKKVWSNYNKNMQMCIKPNFAGNSTYNAGWIGRKKNCHELLYVKRDNNSIKNAVMIYESSNMASTRFLLKL